MRLLKDQGGDRWRVLRHLEGGAEGPRKRLFVAWGESLELLQQGGDGGAIQRRIRAKSWDGGRLRPRLPLGCPWPLGGPLKAAAMGLLPTACGASFVGFDLNGGRIRPRNRSLLRMRPTATPITSDAPRRLLDQRSPQLPRRQPEQQPPGQPQTPAHFSVAMRPSPLAFPQALHTCGTACQPGCASSTLRGSLLTQHSPQADEQPSACSSRSNTKRRSSSLSSPSECQCKQVCPRQLMRVWIRISAMPPP